jgi:hypothetical protein
MACDQYRPNRLKMGRALTKTPGMSQHEESLFDIVRVLATTMIEQGATKVLRARLTAVRHTAFAAGNAGGVEVLDRLIDDLFPPPHIPLKPSFRIV